MKPRSRKRGAPLGGFFILNGVRRALACREAGRKTVPAILYRDGQAPEHRPRVRLTSLFTSKKTVLRDHRYLRIVPPIGDPIEVEPLGARAQSKAMPLEAVRLV